MVTSSVQPLAKGERTRQQIDDAAYALFLDQGFHATSMRQIAQKAGLALGGIYNHFASKEEVFKALLLERHPFHQILPVLLTADGDTVEAFIRTAGATLVQELERRPDMLKLMFIEIVEFNGQHTPLLFGMIFPQLQPLFLRFQSKADGLRDLPPPVMVRAFIGLFFSYFITEYLIGKMMPASMQKDAFEYFVDIYLHGILDSAGQT